MVLLAAYLQFSINRRRDREERAMTSRIIQTNPIDVSALTPAVQRLRKNPSLALHNQPYRSTRKARLVDNAKGIIAGLEFFRHRDEEHAIDSH